MRINSVQNQNCNKRQVNFGCEYCRLARELLETQGFVGHEAEAVLLKVNPLIVGQKAVNALKKTSITPNELHIMRAKNIHYGLSELVKNHLKPDLKLKDALVEPDGLEQFVTAVRENFDDILSLRIGEDIF